MKDSGGTAFGGVDEVVRTFTVTVNPVPDAPAVDTDPLTRMPTKKGAINGGIFKKQEPPLPAKITVLVDDIHAHIARIEWTASALPAGRPAERSRCPQGTQGGRP